MTCTINISQLLFNLLMFYVVKDEAVIAIV